MDLKFIYNPYIVETKIDFDEEIELKKGNTLENFFDSFLNARIQDWNYNDLLKKIFEEFNEEELKLTFKGRDMDYDDFKLGFENALNPDNIKITFDFERGTDNKEIINKLKALFKKIQEGPFEELKTQEIKRIFEKSLNSEFPISVLATVSSGKSTLINALLEKQLLPSMNQACTAKITKIKDIDGMDSFSAISLDKENKQLERINNININELKKMNKDEKVYKIEMFGDVPNISSEDMNLVIYDTPGPNNSQNNNHREHAFKMIESDEKPLILYVINATQLSTNDDKLFLDEIIKKIAEQSNNPDKQSRDRFLFVVNKADSWDTAVDGDIEFLIEKARNYLESFGVKEPIIFPISAEYAKLIRLHKNKSGLTLRQELNLENYTLFLNPKYHLESFAASSKSVNNQIKELIDSSTDSYTKALYHTGIPSLEFTVNEYLKKYALPIKVKKAVESIIRFIEQKKIEESILDSILTDEQKNNNLKEQIDYVLEVINKGQKSSELKTKIKNLKPDYTQLEAKQAAYKIKFIGISDDFSHQGYQTGERKGLIEESRIKYIIKDLKKYINLLLSELIIDTENIINKEIKDRAKDYSYEFHEYVKGLTENFQGVKTDFENKFNSYISVNFPSESEIQNFYEIRNERVGENWKKNEDKKWYKFWTWNDDNYIKEYAYEDIKYINLKEYTYSVIEPLRVNTDRKFLELRNFLDKNIEEIKREFINEIYILEEKLKIKMEEMKQLTQDKITLEQNLNKNQKKNNWLKDINKQIEEILFF